MNSYSSELNSSIIQLPYNCEILLEKDLDIAVRINSAEQSHSITFSILMPRGVNGSKLKLLFTSKDDLFLLYTLEITKEKIYELNDQFGLKLQGMEDFLTMFKDFMDQIQKRNKEACIKFSNQNTLTLEITTIINGKQFLILTLVGQKQQHQVIQAWVAFKYGEMQEEIRKRQQKIYQLKEMVRVKNPYLLNYFDKIQ